MQLQQQYWEQWQRMQQQALGIEQQPRTPPWDAAMRHWQDAMQGALPDFGREFLEKALEQGRLAFEMAEQFSRNLTKDDAMQQLTELLTKSFTPPSGSGLGGNSGFWEMPLDNWQRMASALAPMPGDWLRGVPTTGFKENLDRVLAAPGLGYTRETQAQYQSLLRAVIEYQEALGEYSLFFGRIGEGAGRQLLEMLQQQPVDSARQLYDQWIQCCEARYAEEVMSPEYQRLHGRMVNTLMQVKHRYGQLLDESLSAMNIPTREDLRTMQQRAQEHRRELRALRQEVAELKRTVSSLKQPPVPEAAQPSASRAAAAPAPRPRKKVAAKKRAAKKS
jgi:class III poly(R)-hydroxyalkanoic acid synthase PhaE subunit